MKSNIFFGISLLLISLFLISCEKDNPEGAISCKIVNHTNCKNLKSSIKEDDYDSNISCISYSYDSQNKKLTLKHINAGFNCCPDSLYCSIVLSSDLIVIKEFEKKALCNCTCLYDLDIEITGIELKKYIIKIDEPYCGNQPKLIFEADLAANGTGEFCVNRDEYPWSM